MRLANQESAQQEALEGPPAGPAGGEDGQPPDQAGTAPQSLHVEPPQPARRVPWWKRMLLCGGCSRAEQAPTPTLQDAPQSRAMSRRTKWSRHSKRSPTASPQ